MPRDFFALAFALVAAPALGQTAKLTPSEGAAGDQFGLSVAIGGDHVLVGAPGDGEHGPSSGAAYLFASSGAELAKLTPDDGSAFDFFGASVGVDGNYAVIGAWGEDEYGPNSGSAYLFAVASSDELAPAARLVTKLRPNDAASNHHFGFAVAISGEHAIVGAWGDRGNSGIDAGAAYLFSVPDGEQLAKLIPDDGWIFDHFGRSVAISGGYTIVGARWDESFGHNSGSAYLFSVPGGQELAKLRPSQGSAHDVFASSVAISGDRALVGVPLSNDGGPDSGAAFVYSVPAGVELAKLSASDAAPGDRFGISVALSGDRAVIGASLDDDRGLGSGAAYVFSIATGQELSKLVPADGATTDYFGESVATTADRAIVGAWADDDGGGNSGSAYVW